MKMIMMTNLFTIFDPSTYFFSFNWMNLFLPLMLIPMNYWMIPSFLNMFWMTIMNSIFKEFKLLIKLKFISNSIIFISLMLMISLINLFGLMPYIFTSTSHLSVNLSISMTLWISFMLYGWLNFTDMMLIHHVPMNTPYSLMNFMVLIESISNIIRPWTLTIRLSANMLAGHLLLSLLGSTMNSMIFLLPMTIIIQNLLFILEISVSIIQAYVFSILSVLYFNEVNK